MRRRLLRQLLLLLQLCKQLPYSQRPMLISGPRLMKEVLMTRNLGLGRFSQLELGRGQPCGRKWIIKRRYRSTRRKKLQELVDGGRWQTRYDDGQQTALHLRLLQKDSASQAQPGRTAVDSPQAGLWSSSRGASPKRVEIWSEQCPPFLVHNNLLIFREELFVDSVFGHTCIDTGQESLFGTLWGLLSVSFLVSVILRVF